MGYAFISYSSKDAKIAAKLKNVLDNNGIDSWIAPDDIPVGSKYAKVISSALKNCSCLILLLSDNSQASTWVSKELERAISYEKTIIPIRIEDIILNDEFEFYISTDQIIDVHDFAESDPQVQKLIAKAKECVLSSSFEKSMLSDAVVISSDKAKRIKIKPVHIITSLFVVIAILILVILFGGDKTPDTPYTPPSETVGNNETVQGDEKEPEQQQPVEDTAVGKNEIPEENEKNVTALKYADTLTQQVSTIYVKVGEYATPSAAGVWDDVTIYSENTAVAVGEGILVKGVSKGDTYIVVKTRGNMASAYHVIVE